jgi:hypothetical protein
MKSLAISFIAVLLVSVPFQARLCAKLKFSVQSLSPLCLCGLDRAIIHHGDTEDSETAQRRDPEIKTPPTRQSTTWKLNNLEKIDGNPVSIIGHPRLVDDQGGRAVSFDGVGDGIQIDVNPLAGAQAFTVEAVFRPEAGGLKEQRWLHIQENNTENRILLETRLVDDQWFLDTYIRSGDNNRTLFAENFKHPIGPWYHVALVFDGKEMRHYVDGRQEMSGPLTVSPLTAGKTTIGVRMNRVYWFKGAVRKARFTARALRPEEFMKKN